MCNSTKLSVIFIMTLMAYPSMAEVTFENGSLNVITPADASCHTATNVVDEIPLTRYEPDCAVGNGEAELFMRTGKGFRRVEVRASTRYVVQFSVEDSTPGESGPFIPIHISLPDIVWNGQMYNDRDIPTLGEPVAWANMNMFLVLREGNPANPADRSGPIVALTRFHGASHAGSNACISVPTGYIDAAVAMVNCVLGAFKKDGGRGPVNLSGIVEPGKTYNAEISMTGEVVDDTALEAVGARVNYADGSSGGLGMRWQTMKLALGTDPNLGIAELREELDELRTKFENHTHVYLTGRGTGHNNEEAETAPPVADDGEATTDEGSTASDHDTVPVNVTPTGETQDSVIGGTGSIALLELILLSGLAFGGHILNRR